VGKIRFGQHDEAGEYWLISDTQVVEASFFQQGPQLALGDRPAAT
jgi:hypothetical protein